MSSRHATTEFRSLPVKADVMTLTDLVRHPPDEAGSDRGASGPIVEMVNRVLRRYDGSQDSTMPTSDKSPKTSSAAGDLSPQRRLLSRHRVREQLKDMILNGEHPAGAKLVQDKLAKQLGVSRGVVREALMEMKALGLIQTIDNRGAIVAPMNVQMMLDCLAVREFLEGLAARECSVRVNRLQIRELHEMVQRMHDLATNGHYPEAVRLDRVFHLRQIELSQNVMLILIAENHWILGKSVTTEAKPEPERTRDEHLAILRAIEAGNENEAERAARAHIQYIRRTWEQRIAEGTFAPRWFTSNGKRPSEGSIAKPE